MSLNHNRFHFSIRCVTQDLAVLHCLRALCQHAEPHSMGQIGWGGTGEREWRAAAGQVTFRFTSSESRHRFVVEATRLLNGLWSEIATSDMDAASPQRR